MEHRAISIPDRPDASAPAQPVVWLDVTTSWRARDGQFNGTLRVEQSYARELRKVAPGRLRFCRFDRVRGQFAPVPDEAVALPAKRAETPQSARRLSVEFLRGWERDFRHWWRGLAAGLSRRRTERTGASPFPAARPGDAILLAGETWARYDFAVLRRLHGRHGLRIAAICQDVIPVVCPQFFESRDFVARYRDYVDFLVEDVDLLIAISQSTKADLIAYAAPHGGVKGRLEVLQLGGDLPAPMPPTRPDSLPELAPGSFVLSVSTIQWRKNFQLLYQVWRRLTEERLPDLPKLVIVGRPGFGSADLLWQMAHDPVTAATITVIHNASDEDLTWLYGNCRWTLYPSFYEGWGLPVSESLAHGKYCLASNASSLPEAGQSLVRHLDPLDFAAWRDAVVELTTSPGLLAELESRIRQQHEALSWAQSAERLSGLLRQLVGAAAHR